MNELRLKFEPTYMYLITIRKTARIYVSKFIGIIILKHQLISHTYKETNTVFKTSGTQYVGVRARCT